MGGNLSQSRGWCGLRALRWVAYPSRICWSRGVRFFASSRPTLPFTSTLVLRMRCSRVRRFLSEYPTFDFQLSTFNLLFFNIPAFRFFFSWVDCQLSTFDFQPRLFPLSFFSPPPCPLW